MDEANNFPQRAKRYAKVSTAAVRVGAGLLGQQIRGGEDSQDQSAALIRAALGGLKGPLMKVAQLLATVPDLLPEPYMRQLATLQADAPSMGWPFVRRRMAAELGADWQTLFARFEPQAAAAASLGQVHKAVGPDGQALACKLQYPDMDSTVEADLRQLKIMLAALSHLDGAVQTRAVYQEIAARLREELDYTREASNMTLYRHMLADVEGVRVPQPVASLSTKRLLTMSWLEGQKILDVLPDLQQEARNQIAERIFRLWYTPFYRYGILHGDPHMGNYTLAEDGHINLLDYGCIRIFDPETVQAVVQLHEALRRNDKELLVHCYELWGFDQLSPALIETLSLWAKFIYAPLLEDRPRQMQETNTTASARALVSRIRRALKEQGGVDVPPAFVLIDRASVGLGSLFLHLGAEVNWCRLFLDLTQDFDRTEVANRQKALRESCSSPPLTTDKKPSQGNTNQAESY